MDSNIMGFVLIPLLRESSSIPEGRVHARSQNMSQVSFITHTEHDRKSSETHLNFWDIISKMT
jgi:hypothetical protein